MENDTDLDISRFLRSTSAAMAPDEALRAGPGALIGVSTAAESALATINIHSIFDLAASRVFAAAAALVAIERNPTAVEARLNVVASDVAQMPAGVPVRELANQPISILTAIGETAAPALAQALDVATVRDLALWPPYDAAKAILGAAFFPEQTQCFDSETPSDLLPKSGAYPTERIFFKKLVIDAVPEPTEGAQPIEQAPPIDLATALAAPVGFGRLATGALLTFSQSWFSQGLTLGQLLHSTSLAPGESTRMAVVDWTRRSRAAASEDISESELLSNTMSHSRSLSEVTNATAREFQSGQSSTRTELTAAQAGGGFGLDLGPIAIGGSGGVSTNTTEVMSASSSFGARDLAASYAQDINDRSQQNASSVRNRRASIVREVSQSEHEAISTRCVTNYNHMHALSIHYYEVVQAFRTTTQLERADRCLFVPVKLVDFRDVATVDRWRLVLAGAALSERARRQLTVEYGVVEIIPQTPRITPHEVIVSRGLHVQDSTLAGVKAIARLSSAAIAADGGANAPANEPPAPPPAAPPAPPANPPTPPAVPLITANAPATLLALKGWNLEQLNRIGWATSRVLMQAGSDSVFVSDDAVVVGFSLREGQAARFVVRLHTGEEVTPSATTETAFSFGVPLPITTLESIAVQFTAQQDLSTALILHLNMFGTVMPLDVPIVLKPMSVPREVVKFGSVAGARELIDHLEANRLHYTQAILRALDAATVAALLARFTYRGLPLGQLVDPQPIAVMANFLVFKMNVATGGEADDSRWVEEQQAWQSWLERRGLDRPAPRTEIIPIPSGGLFAEAVLGRYNAAEKTDLTRFWNWQDSPIPLSAPEIAPLQAGSRAQSEEIRPGQLSTPVLTIQSPTALPDPTGIAAIITALQSGNMFRDMSGMAQTAALAQAALQASAQGATAVGEQAAQNLKTVVENTTERMRIAAAVATGGASGLAGGGAGSRPAKNVTEEGARLNFARDMDTRSGSSGSPAGGTFSAGTPVASSAKFAGSEETLPPETVERTLFDRQTGGVAANLANQVADAVGADAGGGGGGGGAAWAAAVEPFPPPPPTLAFVINDPHLTAAFTPVTVNLSTNRLCSALVDLTDNPAMPPYAGLNDEEMVYVGSLSKICAMYAAFALRARVQAFVDAAFSNGASVMAPAIITEIERAWKPKLHALFPSRPKTSFGNNQDMFPRLGQIFDFSPFGIVDFARVPLTIERIDQIGTDGVPEGKFGDWMWSMIRQSNNMAASKCILALGYFYINGALADAGLFDSSSNKGLWVSGDYKGHDWVRNDSERQSNAAGPLLDPHWQVAQAEGSGAALRRQSNFPATAAYVANFMTLLAQGKLVDEEASKDMRDLMKITLGALGSDANDALIEVGRDPTLVVAKFGRGNDSFTHECAIIERTVAGKDLRYIAVGLGSPKSPSLRHQDISDLFRLLDDAIVSIHT